MLRCVRSTSARSSGGSSAVPLTRQTLAGGARAAAMVSRRVGCAEGAPRRGAAAAADDDDALLLLLGVGASERRADEGRAIATGLPPSPAKAAVRLGKSPRWAPKRFFSQVISTPDLMLVRP